MAIDNRRQAKSVTSADETATQALAPLLVRTLHAETASFKKGSSATKVEVTTLTPALVDQDA